MSGHINTVPVDLNELLENQGRAASATHRILSVTTEAEISPES
jgi:hypothetical protein